MKILSEVKKGEWRNNSWKKIYSLRQEAWAGQCSNCRLWSSWIGPNYNGRPVYRYCPHCGAEMTGEDLIEGAEGLELQLFPR